MSQPRRVSATIIVFLMGGIGTALAATAPDAKCAAKKLRCAAKKYAAFATCDWKVVPSGAPVSADCLAGASAKFATGWQKAEATGGCATVGDHDAIEERVDDGRVALETLLGPGPSRCAADRYRAAGRKGRCKLKCAARRVQSAAADAQGRFDECIAGCGIAFSRAFADASDHGDCGTSPSLDAVEAAVDDVVADIVTALQPAQATTTTTTSTTTTLCAPDHCGDGVVETACEQCDGEGACASDCYLNAPSCCEFDLGADGTACAAGQQTTDSGIYYGCIQNGGTAHYGSCVETGPCPSGYPASCMLGSCQVQSFSATSICCQYSPTGCSGTVVQDEAESYLAWRACVYGGGSPIAGTCGADGTCVPDGQ